MAINGSNPKKKRCGCSHCYTNKYDGEISNSEIRLSVNQRRNRDRAKNQEQENEAGDGDNT